jgi:hypothetical protein
MGEPGRDMSAYSVVTIISLKSDCGKFWRRDEDKSTLINRRPELA